MIFVFFIQFLNTGPLLLLINIDITQIWPGAWIWNEGLHTDFSVSWYKDVGDVIISTMIVNIFWPIIEFFIFFGIRLAYRLWDSSFTLKSTQTKKTSTTEYESLYSGPEY